MTVQAAVTLYRKEWMAAYEQRVAQLPNSTTREFQVNGLTTTWLVAGSGGAKAVTRGQNGNIPYGTPSNSQISATLVEKHAPLELTGFDIFASQGNQMQIMQDASLAIIHRDQDLTILAELANATQDFGTGTLDIATVAFSKAILGQNFVDTNNADDMFMVITPAAEAYLMQTTEFTSADYREVKPLDGSPGTEYRHFMGFNWIVSPMLTGVGTSSEVMYAYHRSAIGYTCNVGEENLEIDRDKKQDSSWSRATIYHVAKILQNGGIIKLSHDGSAAAAT